MPVCFAGRRRVAQLIKEMVKGVTEHYLFYRDGERTVFEPKEFAWVSSAEAEWKTIRE